MFSLVSYNFAFARIHCIHLFSLFMNNGEEKTNTHLGMVDQCGLNNREQSFLCARASGKSIASNG